MSEYFPNDRQPGLQAIARALQSMAESLGLTSNELETKLASEDYDRDPEDPTQEEIQKQADDYKKRHMESLASGGRHPINTMQTRPEPGIREVHIDVDATTFDSSDDELLSEYVNRESQDDCGEIFFPKKRGQTTRIYPFDKRP